MNKQKAKTLAILFLVSSASLLVATQVVIYLELRNLAQCVALLNR